MEETTRKPISIKNIQLFIAFRVFFNARFYYPVFTVIFLDFGLTIEQFAILNSVWAVTIVLAEVPSGALADTLGRKKLILTTSLLMMVEMALLCFVPLGNSTLIFYAFLINRVLSGLAEAMASGADEAIAYDSLVEVGMEKRWPEVLSLQMRVSSIASIVTMTLGAFLYDPDMINGVMNYLGVDTALTQQQTMRFPLYLTLVLSFLAIATALQMRESSGTTEQENVEEEQNLSTMAAMRKTWQAGGWILATPFALTVILFGMTFDHVVRMMVTMTSQYYRLVDIPEGLFGIIAAVTGLLGLFVPKVAEKMAASNSPQTNMLIISAITMVGFIGLTFFIPYFGAIPMALIFVAIMLTSFFTSHYLNRITSSDQRATVLSFKGLAFNLSYGGIGLLFAALVQHLRGAIRTSSPDLGQTAVENLSFIQATGWFPWYTLGVLGVVTCIAAYLLRGTSVHKEAG